MLKLGGTLLLMTGYPGFRLAKTRCPVRPVFEHPLPLPSGPNTPHALPSHDAPTPAYRSLRVERAGDGVAHVVLIGPGKGHAAQPDLRQR